MTRIKFILISSLLLLLVGCQQKQKMENFTYKYSMESTNNYKVDFQLNPDSSYIINQNNQFFDKFDGVYRPILKEGFLTESEYNKLEELINKSNLEKMKDSYGFGDNSDKTVMYNLELSYGDTHKYVVINLKSDQEFSKSFIELIEYTNSLIDLKIKS